MSTNADPELAIIRRLAPFGLPALALALLVGAAAGGWNVGWSALLGVAVVWANSAVSALSVARAARISLTALYAVALGGFVVRMAVIVAIMAGLNRLAFFSPLAFGLAVVPATLLMLVFEMKLLAGGLGAELHVQASTAAAGRGATE
ncbi:MAG TPA: hypothetical protein VKA30_07960 [Actinomycetota bacterium]|nr:hypothetical protein [Actinomycetota bacterium]